MPSRYKAFISYSHMDEAFARWLHRQIEGWRVPRDLVGRDTPYGPVPGSLRPVFRDRDDFSGGSSLSGATAQALADSDALVVICSPHAAASSYVDEEIRMFKTLGRADRIVPIIIAGEPGSPSRECFPAWLRLQPDADGKPVGVPSEPIAADARDSGDGRRRAVAKVVAGLLGVPFDEIARREEHARRARTAMLAGGGLGAFVFATAFAAYALYQSQQARLAIDRSVFSMGGLVQSTERLPEDGDVGETRKGMLREQCDLIDGLRGADTVVGAMEQAICFYERTVRSPDQSQPSDLLRTLCPWRDGLVGPVLARDSPSFDESVAAVFAVGRVMRLVIADPAAAAPCSPVAGAKAEDHLAQTLNDLARLGAKRPDLDGLRVIHEDATWSLLRIVEDKGEWQASAKWMIDAMALRKLEMASPSSHPLHPAAYDYGVYLRRLGWLSLTHLGDPKAALAYAREAEQLWRVDLAASASRTDVGYQTLLALEVLGDALGATGDTATAIATFETAVQHGEALAAAVAKEDDEGRKQIQQDVDYCRRRLGELQARR